MLKHRPKDRYTKFLDSIFCKELQEKKLNDIINNSERIQKKLTKIIISDFNKEVL